MFTIIGVKLTSFSTEDGTKVTGYNVYITEERDDVDGLAADRVFISDRVCNRSNFTPMSVILSSLSLILSMVD